jgi:hypothetical protein
MDDGSCSVYSVVHRDLSELPESVATSVDAVIALKLAEALDNQIGGAAASKELRAIMAALKSGADESGDALDDLAARREKRRGA